METMLVLLLAVALVAAAVLFVRSTQLRNRLSELSTDLERLKNSAGDNEKEARKTLDQLQRLQKSEAELKERLADAKKKAAQARDDEKKKTAPTQLEEQVARQTARAERLEDALKAAQETAEKRTKDAAERDQKIADYERRTAELNQQLNAAQARVEALKAEAAKPVVVAPADPAAAEKQQRETAALRRRAEDAENKIKAAQLAAGQAQMEVRQLRARLEKERRVAIVANLQLEAIQDNIMELKRQRDDLAQQYSQRRERRRRHENRPEGEAKPAAGASTPGEALTEHAIPAPMAAVLEAPVETAHGARIAEPAPGTPGTVPAVENQPVPETDTSSSVETV